MNRFSDIVGLFSKLPYDPEQYQEIKHSQDVAKVGVRWSLLGEIFHATSKPKDTTGGQA